MVKSRAEIQREYRKRLKEDPAKYEEYLARARARKQKNYVPADNLSRSEKARRSEKNKEYLKRHRQKKRREIHQAEIQDIDNTETSGYESASIATSTERNRMLVNMPFPNRRNGPRTRIARSLAKKSKELKQMKNAHETLQLKYRRTLRNLQRLRKKCKEEEPIVLSKESPRESQSIPNNQASTSSQGMEYSDTQQETVSTHIAQEETPNTKTKLFLKSAGLTKNQHAKVKKQLLLGFVLESQIKKQNIGLKPSQKGSLRGLIGGKILAKYRLKNVVNRNTGMGRNRMHNYKDCGVITKFKRRRERVKYEASVIEFLSRDDNSRANPGKADKVKYGDSHHQTRTLTDYLSTLHQKFLSENLDMKLSLASFCRMRPKFIRLTSFISRSCCLCTKHQNMALCVRAIRNCGISIPLNPEKFVDEHSSEVINEQLPENIKFGQWKRVPIEEKGRKKVVMKIVDQELDKSDFIAFLNTQKQEFQQHVNRVKRQYSEISKLKKDLRPGEVVVHMDFAENYSCKSVEEIQSAYWTQTGVTLHPVVVYYASGVHEKLDHTSFVIVSNEMGHNSTTVLTFLDAIIPEIKKKVSTIKRMHYWTDSPTSQYRNKAIFNLIANHEATYGMPASWNYFEAGHGKGPCDGLGGVTKRMADEAVRCGKTVIQDAGDFFAWTQSDKCSMRNVNFVYVSAEDCKNKFELLSKIKLQPLKGTMKIHAVIGKRNEDKIITADVSCYCESCLDEKYCQHWISHASVTAEIPEIEIATETISESKDEDLPENEYTVGEFVATVYLNQWYIGQVVTYDDTCGEYEVTFMKKTKTTFQWPFPEDKIWIDKKDVLTRIVDPVPTGKSKRMFKIDKDDIDKVATIFSSRYNRNM